MITLAIILGPMAAIAGAIAFSRCPRASMVTSLLILFLGAVTIGFLFYGPKNYMLQVPESLATHCTLGLWPWQESFSPF
jgi:hypothetical protein